MIGHQRARGSSDVRITFSLPVDDPPGPVSVVGDFNGWTPGRHVLVRRANGRRSVSVTVAPGAALHFRYLGEHGVWFDDPDAETVDEVGGLVRA